MAQIKGGPATSYLGIIHYDLNKNTLDFNIAPNRDDRISAKIFNRIWNPETLEFDVNEFLIYKNISRSALGYPPLKFPNPEPEKGYRAGFYTPPVSQTSQLINPIIKVRGIDTEAFLNKIGEHTPPSPSK